MLSWYQRPEGFCANSCIHDEGSPFQYVFEKTECGWANKTDAELIYGPTVEVFDNTTAAKAWAERMESRWSKVDFDAA